MTTRLNLRNISRKNITVEIIPRNNGSVNFRGDTPINAVQENGAMKLTLSTNKIDRVGFTYPSYISSGDLILEHVGDQQINRALIGWESPYWGDRGEKTIQSYSLAQLGIGQAFSNEMVGTDGNRTDGIYATLYNNTDQPIVLRGLVDLNGAYFNGGQGGSSGGSNGSMIDYGSNGSMIDGGSNGSMIDYGSNGSMIDGGSNGSMIDGGSNGSMIDGSMIDDTEYWQGESQNYLDIDAKTHNILLQDPDLNNPTFAQEKGKWGVVLGAEHHRAGTHLEWVITLPPHDSEILQAVIYLPYTHIDRFGREYRGQSVVTISRESSESYWWNNISQESVARLLAQGIYNAEGAIAVHHYADEAEYCMMSGPDAYNPYNGIPPTDYGIYYQYPEVLPGWDPDAPTIAYIDYGFNYNDGMYNWYGQNLRLSISGLSYVGLTKGGYNVDNTTEEDGYNRDLYEDRGINQMAASKIIFHPNEPFYNTDSLEIPEELAGRIVFINAARNTYDQDNLGFIAAYDNLKDFAVRSSGYNTSGNYYNAVGEWVEYGNGEQSGPIELS